jgi:hypothetical protein
MSIYRGWQAEAKLTAEERAARARWLRESHERERALQVTFRECMAGPGGRSQILRHMR